MGSLLSRLRGNRLLLGFIPLLLAVTAQAVYAAHAQKALTRKALEAKALSLTRLLVAVVEPFVLASDARGADESIAYARNDPDFAHALVFVEGGWPIAYAGPAEVKLRLLSAPAIPPEMVTAWTGDEIAVTAPIFFEGKTIGALVLGLTSGATARASDAAVVRTLLISLLAAVIAVLLAVRFESERKKSLRALREANRALEAASAAKSQFLANMSHEIRTPMAAITGYADLLLEPGLDASDRVNHVQTIRRNGDHLLSILNDILDLSKIEAGKMSAEKLPLSPAQVVADVASLLRVRALERGLTLDVEFAGDLPAVIESDPTRLRQIMMNLVANAIKFTERGSVRVALRCERAPGGPARLCFQVTDTGIGLGPDELQRLFQPFTQADSSTTRKFGGTGLGLVICQRMAAIIGGSIEVQSQPGRGSTFTLALEVGDLTGVQMLRGLTEAMVALPPLPGGPPARPKLAVGLRVLLAEDGRDNQLLVRTHLSKAGAQVVLAEDGQQAVEQVMAAIDLGQPFDVVLMDMQMPVLDGYGATAKLRGKGVKTPVVALTAHAMAGDRARCISAGCDDYLTKPIDRASLLAAVARWGARGREQIASAPPRPPQQKAPGTRRDDPGPLTGAPLYSEFGDDPDMHDIVVTFVQQLAVRATELEEATAASDRGQLQRLAHQLKGAAGSYGFASITEAAETLEMALTEGSDPALVSRCMHEVAALCRRARAMPIKAA